MSFHRPSTALQTTLSDLQRVLQAAAEERTLYRGFVIKYDPPPIPDRQFDWRYEHESFDGAPDAGDRRYGHCPSLAECKHEIDEYYDDIEFAPGPPLPPEDEPNGWDDCEVDRYEDEETAGTGFEEQW